MPSLAFEAGLAVDLDVGHDDRQHLLVDVNSCDPVRHRPLLGSGERASSHQPGSRRRVRIQSGEHRRKLNRIIGATLSQRSPKEAADGLGPYRRAPFSLARSSSSDHGGVQALFQSASTLSASSSSSAKPRTRRQQTRNVAASPPLPATAGGIVAMYRRARSRASGGWLVGASGTIGLRAANDCRASGKSRGRNTRSAASYLTLTYWAGPVLVIEESRQSCDLRARRRCLVCAELHSEPLLKRLRVLLGDQRHRADTLCGSAGVVRFQYSAVFHMSTARRVCD